MFPNALSKTLTATAFLAVSAISAQAATISATFNGTLMGETDSYYSMYYGTPDFRFEGAQYEITIHGDDTQVSNYNSSWRGSAQKYDFTRFDVTVDLSITGGAEDVTLTGQNAQLSFYNFLNESPYSDQLSMGVSGQTAGGDYISFGLNAVYSPDVNVIWDTDGFITSLGALVDPDFKPAGVNGFLSDSSDNYAQYNTGSLYTGPASAEISPVPLPAGGLLLLTGLGALVFGRRKA